MTDLTKFLSEQAVAALLDEVHLTPKPGLVDLRTNGAHSDMSVALFEKSAAALRPYFETAAELGASRENTMPELQDAGLEAEQAMLSATAGVNTHKGAIYAFGIMISALASSCALGSEPFSTAAMLAENGKAPEGKTHGNVVRMKHRRCGARQEALEGFPNALSAYNVLLESGSLHRTLLWLMASVPDTNLLYRGGIDGLTFVQEEAKKLLHLPETKLIPAMERFDDTLIEKNLSPGGSADLLALAILLQKTESIWNP